MFDSCRSSPVFWFLLGGLVALILIERLFEPSFLPPVLIASVLVLGVCLIASFGPEAPSHLLPVLLGFSGFLLYGGYLTYRTTVERHWLLNRRLNIEGIWDPPNRLDVRRINGDSYRTRLYLKPDGRRRDLMQYRGDGRVQVNLTGGVDWYGVDPSFRGFLFSRGFRGVLDVERLHSLDLGPSRETGYLSRFRGWIDRYLEALRPRAPTSVAMLQALILGTKEFSNQLTILLRRLGLYHLFVISGLHVGVIFYGLQSLFNETSSLIGGSITGLVLVTYVSFLGWPVPATRAMVMIGIGGLSSYLNRRSSLVEVLCLTVLLFMILDPFVVFEVGFQLSVAAVAGIVLVQPFVERFSDRWWARLAMISLGAYSGVLPVLLFHFGYVSPLALPGSFIGGIFFPVLLVLLGLQLSFLAVSWSAPSRLIEAGLTQGIRYLTGFLSDWSVVLEFPEVTVPTVIVILCLLFLILRFRSSIPVRLLSTAVLLCGLWLGRAAADPVPSVVLQRTAGTPTVFFTTMEGRRGLFLPSGTRLDTFSFYSLARRLKSRGIHHIEYLIGNYSRGMLRRVDPPVTIGTVVTSWHRRSRVSFGGIRFARDGSTISTGSFNIHFEGRTKNGVPLRSNGLGAVTSTEKCLVLNASVVPAESFRKLRNSGCQLLFLEDAPVRFDLSGRILGRGLRDKKTFAGRILSSVRSARLLFSGVQH